MKLTILSQYYAPDHTATGQILHELAAELVRGGDEVTVLTAQPMYALKELRPSRETLDGVRVIRVRSTRLDKNSKVGKILNALTFFFAVLWHALFLDRTHPVMIVSNPPFLPVVGWILKLTKNQNFTYLVHDVYPDIAVSLGYLKSSSPVVALWNWLNARVYASASHIIVLSETMRDVIRRKPNVRPELIHVIHNWSDGDAIRPLPKADNPFALELGLECEFVIQYSGNMGLFHDLEGLMAVARDMVGQPVRFLMIGDGGKRKKLEALAEGLPNVTFLPYQPKSQLGQSLTACDVAVVTLEQGIEGLAAPSKLYGILAAGRAVLAIVEDGSYIKSLVDEGQCGVAVPPNDIEALKQAIGVLSADPGAVSVMGNKARALFERHFTLDFAVNEYRKVISSIE